MVNLRPPSLPFLLPADGPGKLPEANTHEKKSQGKYSLEGALLLKTHAALQGLGKGEVV